MKIYLMTDMEGCAGMLNHDDWVLPSGRYYDTGQELLCGEVNAAVEGFLEAGATEIVVMDGHGAGGLHPLLLHPAARLARGTTSPPYPFLLDDSYDAIAWVGQHAKAGTPYSHITHTNWFDAIDLSINGISIGEYGEMALCAMELGMPSIFAAGEQALCEEAAALTPGVVTVAVKRGVLPDGLDHLSMDEYRRAKLAAIHLSPVEARKHIREGAALALNALKISPEVFRYPALSKPYVKRIRSRSRGDQPASSAWGEHPDSIIGLLNAPWQEGNPPE